MQTPSTPQLPENTVEILVALAFAAVLSGAIALIAGGLVRRLVTSLEGHTHFANPLRKAPVRLVRIGTFVVSMIALTFPALTFVGVAMPAELQGERLGQWVARTALRIGVIVVAAITASHLVTAIMTRAQREMAAGGAARRSRASETRRDDRTDVQRLSLGHHLVRRAADDPSGARRRHHARADRRRDPRPRHRLRRPDRW